jgi:hypothetical protein
VDIGGKKMIMGQPRRYLWNSGWRILIWMLRFKTSTMAGAGGISLHSFNANGMKRGEM